MKNSIKVSIIILILGIISYFAYNLVMRWHEDELQTSREQVRRELILRETPAISKEKLVEALGEVSSEVPGEEKQISFEEIERRTMAFYSYLDLQAYVQEYKLEKGTYYYFSKIVDNLSSNLPVVEGETESLFTILKNMSHLYRALGRKGIDLTKEILKNESEIIEPVMETFYLWVIMNNNTDKTIKGQPSLKSLYEYSGYFLNTLAGRNYLLRRDPKIRILTTYYCTLILDKANDSRLNPKGIDIRPHINSLLIEINNRTGLVDKEKYLSELERLKEKYQI